MQQNTPPMNHWLISELGSSQYLLNASQIVEIVPQADLKISEIAGSSQSMLGIADYRGHALKVFGLRQALGLPTLEEEIGESQKLLTEHEQGHKNWITELELSVKEGRSFRLATDPNRCKFGQWYNTIMNDENAMQTFCAGDPLLRILLADFDKPHKAIHGIAQKITQLVHANKNDEATAIIESTRQTTLSELLALFERVRRLLGESRRSVVIVLKNGHSSAGVLVDAVNMIIHVESGEISPLEQNTNMPKIFSGILTKHQHLNAPTPVIDTHYLFGTQTPKNAHPAVTTQAAEPTTQSAAA